MNPRGGVGERPLGPGVFPPMSQHSIVARLAEEKGLVIASPEALTLRRQRCGKGFAFVTPSGAFVQDAACPAGKVLKVTGAIRGLHRKKACVAIGTEQASLSAATP